MGVKTVSVALRSGHWPTLLGAWLYLTVSFMVWLLFGALAVAIGDELRLTAAQLTVLVALPLLSGALLRIAAGWSCDWYGAKRTGLAMLGLQLAAVLWAAFGGTTYGELLGTPEAAAFAARVQDVHEWLAPRVGNLPAATPTPTPAGVVAVQDPCHLRHVQKRHQAVRDVLAPYVTVVDLDDEGLCCGAGGAYSATHPELAGAIRARKLEAIDRAGAPVVASANPGCALHLAAAGVTVRHPMEILDDCLSARHEE